MRVRMLSKGRAMSTHSRRTVCARLAAAAVSVLLPTIAVAQTEPPARHKALIQVSDNDPQKWNLALNNARNLQDDLTAYAVDLEIVVYGPGIGMLKSDSAVAKRVADALQAGVQVVACENTMRNQKLSRADMLPGIGYVGAGVVEIIKKQEQGWAYIRP
jgi:intracellular sulfur oxidation DsrE/DsrF family protein